jgi:hypothetical protein
MLMDRTTILERSFRAIWTLLSEGELRAQLALTWFSEPDIESGIQVARTWSTTVTPTPVGQSGFLKLQGCPVLALVVIGSWAPI